VLNFKYILHSLTLTT